MIETICDPFGKTAFPQVVKCDGCGCIIKRSGTMASEDEHFCDDCSTPANQEFRICNHCGLPMIDGMTNEGGWVIHDFDVHEECFEAAMDERYGKGKWRPIEGDMTGGNDGYYEALTGDEADPPEWIDTGIYYTQW